MELTGKTINFLGDSITEGAGASAPDKCYVEVLRRNYGLTHARNYGISGTRIAHQMQASDNPRNDLDSCGRFHKMDDHADAVVVFGGTNDFGHGLAPFREIGDFSPDTFCGACDTLYKGLRTKYPHIPVIIVTPTPRRAETDPHGDGSKPTKQPLCAYVDAIQKIAAVNGLPVLDLFHCAPVGHRDLFPPELFPDGLHPNDIGHARLAAQIAEFLQTL